MRAQYQHSTKKGSRSRSRLRKYPLNLRVLGVTTDVSIAKIPSLRRLHFGSEDVNKLGLVLRADSRSSSSISVSVSRDLGHLACAPLASTSLDILLTCWG